MRRIYAYISAFQDLLICALFFYFFISSRKIRKRRAKTNKFSNFQKKKHMQQPKQSKTTQAKLLKVSDCSILLFSYYNSSFWQLISKNLEAQND